MVCLMYIIVDTLHKVTTRMIIGNEHWNENVPKLTEKNFEGKATILWNQQAQTDRTVAKK